MLPVTETNILEKMLDADKNACLIIEEAKNKANAMIIQARVKAQKLIEKTRQEQEKIRQAMEDKLLYEGENEVARLLAEKDKYIQAINKKAFQQREQLLQELRTILFGDLWC